MPANVPDRFVTVPVLVPASVQVPPLVLSVPVVPVSEIVPMPANVPLRLLEVPVLVAVSV
jgi:hypothetical protein